MNLIDRILLISANNWVRPYPVYPIGVSYLKSYINKEMPQVNVDIVDMNFTSVEELEKRLLSTKYSYIGMSLRNIDDNNASTKNSFVVWYKRLAKVITSSSDAFFIIGGAGYSIYPQMLLNELDADFGIKGEGESALCQLIDALNRGENVEDIEGLVYRTDDGIKVNDRVNFARSSVLDFEEEWVDYYWERSGMLNIQTKRGCPGKCIYCSYPVIEGRCIRTLESDAIVSTLLKLNAKHKISYVFFTDSIFNIDRNYNRELCNKIIASGLKISWGAYFSPKNIIREDLELYKRSGLTHIEFGSDSFSDRQLELFKKGFSWGDILNASKICDDLGIFYAHFMILGGPGEDDKSLDETFKNSSALTNCVIFPYVGMRVYPSTELYKIAIKEGLIHNEEELLMPVYYISDKITLSTVKSRAIASGAKWIFPEDESDEMIAKFRAKKRRGPLWEYYKFQ